DRQRFARRRIGFRSGPTGSDPPARPTTPPGRVSSIPCRRALLLRATDQLPGPSLAQSSKPRAGLHYFRNAAGRVSPPPSPESSFAVASACWCVGSPPPATPPKCECADTPPANDSPFAMLLQPSRRRARSQPPTPPHYRRAPSQARHSLSLQVAGAAPPPDPPDTHSTPRASRSLLSCAP